MSRLATNFTVLDQALVSGVNFITGLVLARFLGIDAYGLFILLSGVILFASNIQNAIIISPMMVNGPAHDQNEVHNYYQSSLLIQILLTLIFFMTILFIGYLLIIAGLKKHLDSLILPLALATSGLLIQEYFRRYFFSIQNTIQALINDCISYGLQLITIIAAQFIYGIDIKLCLYIMAATSFIAVMHGILYSHLFTSITASPLKLHRNTIIEHWNFGKWLLARNITYWIGTQMVIYMTGILLSVTAVGAMGAARNIVGIVNILFLAIDNFATPRASVIYAKKSITGLRKYVNRLVVLGGLVTGGISILASAMPEFWLNLAYSVVYKGYGEIVIAWSLFYFIGFFQRPYGIGLRVINSTKTLFKGTVLGSLISVSLSYPVISYFGLAGAMTVMILTQMTISMYYFIKFNNIRIY